MEARPQCTPSGENHAAASFPWPAEVSHPTATTREPLAATRFMVWSPTPPRTGPGSGTRRHAIDDGNAGGWLGGGEVGPKDGVGEPRAEGVAVADCPASGRPSGRGQSATPATIATATAAATPASATRRPRRPAGRRRGAVQATGAGGSTPSAAAAAATSSVHVG